MQASLSFEPSQTSASTGDVIPVDIYLNDGNNAVISSDIWISYNPSLLNVTSSSGTPTFEKGPLFENVQAKNIAPGSLYLYAIKDTSSEKGSTGKVATVYFTAVKGGKTDLRFDCVPFGEKTSQIIQNSAELDNVINCTLTRAHISTVQIHAQDNVLGAATSRSFLSPVLYLGIGLLMAVLAGLLIYRYRKLSKQLSSE